MTESVARYASILEKKLIDEFKAKFREKIGYQPIVLTKVTVDDEHSIPLMPLDQLADYFTPFLPTQNGRVLPLFAKSRKRELVELRMIFCTLARSMKYTLVSIGEYIGGRDHTTVLHAVSTFNNLVETNEAFRDQYMKILTYIKQSYESSTLDQPDQVQPESEPALLP